MRKGDHVTIIRPGSPFYGKHAIVEETIGNVAFVLLWGLPVAYFLKELKFKKGGANELIGEEVSLL